MTGSDRTGPVERAVFVLSVAVLAFLYGIATEAFGWPPSGFLTRAWRQFRTVAGLLAPDERYGFLVPRVYDRAGARAPLPEAIHPGLTLVASYREAFDWKPALALIDAAGRAVHAWRVDPAALFPESADRAAGETVDRARRHVHGFHLAPDGEVTFNLEYLGTVRMDACGNVLWRLPRGGHHSVVEADDGSLWIPGSERVDEGEGRARRDRFPGFEDFAWEDRILHVSAAGEVLGEIGLFDVLASDPLRRFAAGTHRGDPDLSHLNDVEPLPEALATEYPAFEAGDLLVSLHDLHLVAVLDPRSGAVKASWAGPFVGQHDPDWLGDGWIGVFDNRSDRTPRGTMLGGSRVVAVRPGDDATRVLFPGAGSEPLYTAYMGEWQRLDNGNMLLVESVAGRVVEVTPDGRTAWEWIVEPYDEEFVPWVTGAERVPITAEDVAGWTCRDGEPAGAAR